MVAWQEMRHGIETEVLRVLELNDSLCLDNAAEREAVASAIADALLATLEIEN